MIPDILVIYAQRRDYFMHKFLRREESVRQPMGRMRDSTLNKCEISIIR